MQYNNEYNFDLYPKQLHWQEGDLTATRTTQWSGPGCHDGCQVIFYTDKDGKIVKVEGDPNSPYNQGRLCMRCLEMPQLINSERRLRYPMKRAKEDRGKDKWERITWDEAYQIITDEVRKIQAEDGPEAICSIVGTGRNTSTFTAHNQYANFGGPDMCLAFLSGNSCYIPRTAACYVSGGNIWVADFSQFSEQRYDDNPEWVAPECCVIWGHNPTVANADAFLGHWIIESMKRGTQLITIDPRLTWIAAQSKYWLRLRPGTDGALALGWLNVIINEDLYDHEFVDKWTYGFEQLKERVQEYTPERVAEICWLDKDLIIESARFYATSKPASMQWGLAIDCAQAGVPAALAISCLVGITGNIEVPGGNIFMDESCGLNFSSRSGDWELTQEMLEKRLGREEYIMTRVGFSPESNPDTVLKCIETGKPRPIRMLWMYGGNSLANMGQDAPRLYRAFRKLDFFVVVDLFMTPTIMASADMVLPCAMSPERNSVRVWFDPARSITKCSQFYEAKSDPTIMVELGKYLAPDKWPEWVNDDRDYMNWRLQRDDVRTEDGELVTMDILENHYHGMWYQPFRYHKHEKGLLRKDGQPGFATPTGRYELYCTTLASVGEDPLPYYEEPPTSPISTPELYEKYPFILTTGARSYEFFHSEWRQPETISRELHPVPQFWIHPDKAAELGICEGQWCWIENQMGKMKQTAHLDSTIDPRIISTEHGWWFPERMGEEPELFGVFDCNPNNLLPQEECGRVGLGAPIKCALCTVYPCTPENDGYDDQPSHQVSATGWTHGETHETDQPSFYDGIK